MPNKHIELFKKWLADKLYNQSPEQRLDDEIAKRINRISLKVEELPQNKD